MYVRMCLHALVLAAVESIDALGSIPRVPPRRSLPPWEVKIMAAQSIIFNQELFSHVGHTLCIHTVHTYTTHVLSPKSHSCTVLYMEIYMHSTLAFKKVDVHVVMRDEKEGRSKQVWSNKQTTRQSNTAHPRQSLLLRKMSCLGWDSNPRHSTL